MNFEMIDADSLSFRNQQLSFLWMTQFTGHYDFDFELHNVFSVPAWGKSMFGLRGHPPWERRVTHCLQTKDFVFFNTIP